MLTKADQVLREVSVTATRCHPAALSARGSSPLPGTQQACASHLCPSSAGWLRGEFWPLSVGSMTRAPGGLQLPVAGGPCPLPSCHHSHGNRPRGDVGQATNLGVQAATVSAPHLPSFDGPVVSVR